MASPYHTTADGFEAQIGTNHFGPFLFTALIFDRLVEAGSCQSPSRIVNVSSAAHRRAPRIDASDVNFSGGATYEKWAAYSQSKLANILFANELARKTSEKGIPVHAHSLHPGGTYRFAYLRCSVCCSTDIHILDHQALSQIFNNTSLSRNGWGWGI
jgi:NAD(P)-dependent dehydrogenase (short-subunit alcohol dehydrogenase family)